LTPPGVVFRSAAFALTLAAITPPYAIVSLLVWPLPPLVRYRIVTSWSRLVIALARTLCGIRYRVRAAEPLPPGPCIVMSKHQSAWETLAFQAIFPPQVLVVKKQLLRIPFFGWGLATLSPVAIDRTTGTKALRQVLAQGADRLARGFWVVVFPEGTRMRHGERGRYQPGGAMLAARTGAAVIPVAHDAGRLWPRNGFLKYPGTVTVSIGAPIATAGRRPDAILGEVEAWIEAEMPRLGADA